MAALVKYRLVNLNFLSTPLKIILICIERLKRYVRKYCENLHKNIDTIKIKIILINDEKYKTTKQDVRVSTATNRILILTDLGIHSTPTLKGTFYFSHSEAVLPFVGLLGLYKDSEAPRHDNFEEMKDRKYRSVLINR